MKEELRADFKSNNWITTDILCPSCIEIGLTMCNDEGNFPDESTYKTYTSVVKGCRLCVGTCRMPIPYVELTGQPHEH